MITTLLNTLLTPAALAELPPSMPAIEQTYNWSTQMSELKPGTSTEAAGPSVRGTFSFVPGTSNQVVDNSVAWD